MQCHPSLLPSSTCFNVLLSRTSIKGQLGIGFCSIQEEVEKVRMSGTGCSNAAYAMSGLLRPNGHQVGKSSSCCQFQMPLHYPKYKKSDYETMPEWKLDCLLNEYGLPVTGDVNQKRKFAMGAFLWPSQE